MEFTRSQVIVIMGLMAFAVRALPQLFFVGEEFPETWDRLLRYLSYAFICSIVSITLFMSGARFDGAAAPQRALALAVTLAVARLTKSAAGGMIAGMILTLVLTWFG